MPLPPQSFWRPLVSHLWVFWFIQLGFLPHFNCVFLYIHTYKKMYIYLCVCARSWKPLTLPYKFYAALEARSLLLCSWGIYSLLLQVGLFPFVGFAGSSGSPARWKHLNVPCSSLRLLEQRAGSLWCGLQNHLWSVLTRCHHLGSLSSRLNAVGLKKA